MTDNRSRRLNVLLILILAYLVLAVVGWIVNGLLWLFALAVALFVLTTLRAVYQAGQRRGRRIH